MHSRSGPGARWARFQTNRRLTLVAVFVAVIIVLGIIGYSIAGFNLASARISSADRTIKTVVSHQNTVNTTFRNFDTKLNGLGANADPVQARTLLDQFVSDATVTVALVTQDDSSLVKAAAGLNDKQWLTLTSRGSLDAEATRIAHARKALADAVTVAAGYGLDGLFLEAYLDTTADLADVGKQYGSGNVAAALAALASMKTHADHALQLSTAPGLPAELHDLAVDLETLASDIGNLLAAAAAGNAAGKVTNQAKVATDVGKINGYSFERVGIEIDAFYKPLIDGYNSEMAAATG